MDMKMEDSAHNAGARIGLFLKKYISNVKVEVESYYILIYTSGVNASLWYWDSNNYHCSIKYNKSNEAVTINQEDDISHIVQFILYNNGKADKQLSSEDKLYLNGYHTSVVKKR